MLTTALPSGESVPVLGQGTWNLGDNPRQRFAEIEALRLGLDLGMTLIDTADMYGSGASGAPARTSRDTRGRRSA
jgi:diketogulonate reductase-like aldo/keto reductase